MDRTAPILLERLGSLADETRLRILLILERAELSVAELCDVLQLPQSTVSRHLRVLSDRGWIESRRRGPARLYRMDRRGLDAAAEALWRATREAGEDWPAARHDRMRLEAVRRRRERAEAFFSSTADRWDEVRRELYGQDWMVASIAALLPPDWEVADLGCGTGRLARMLAARVRRVWAVDGSRAMLAAARRELDGVPNARLVGADLAALPLPDACVDAALMLLSLTWVDDPERVLAQAARILRPGGRLVLVDLLEHDRAGFRETMGHARAGFAPQELARTLCRVGLAGVRAAPLPAEPGARGPALLLATGDRPPTGQSRDDGNRGRRDRPPTGQDMPTEE